MSNVSAMRKPEQTFTLASMAVDRRDLLRALKIVLPVVERRNTIPILGCVLFSIADGRISLRATDMDIHLVTGLDVKTGAACAFALANPQRFASLLARIPADTIELALTSGEVAWPLLVLTSGTMRAEFGTMEPTDMPDLPVVPANGISVVQFGGPQLLDAIDKVSFAISTEETRYYLNGIYLHMRPEAGGGNAPWMVTTDGHRLSLARIAPDLDLPAADGPVGLGQGSIIQRRAIPVLVSLAKHGAVSLSFWGLWVRAESGGVTMYAKLIDGTFPDYERVIPSGNDKSAIIPTDLIRAAIGRCVLAATKKTKAVRVTIGDCDVALKVRSPEGMSITESVDLPGMQVRSRHPFEHGLNARYFAEALKRFPGAATYRWADAAAPIVIYAADVASQAEASHIVVQMPMSV